MHDPADDISFEDACRIIRETPEVAEHAEALIAELEPFVRIWPGEAGYPADPLASRFGGDRALMLPEEGWPTWVNEPYHGRDESAETYTLTYGAAEEKPLKFLAQVNLAELPVHDRIPLPREGLLSFFVDSDEAYGAKPGEQDAFRLYHVPPERFVDLEEREMPNMRTTSVFGNDALAEHPMHLAISWRNAPFAAAAMPEVDKANLILQSINQLIDSRLYDDGFLTLPGARGEPPQVEAFIESMPEEDREREDVWDDSELYKNAFGEWVVLLNVSDTLDIGIDRELWHLAFCIRRADLAIERFDRYWGSVSV